MTTTDDFPGNRMEGGTSMILDVGSNDHPATVDESGTPSRKTPGRPPSLTEDQIVDAALEIIRSEGLDALSMRRLSQQLGRSQMAAYSYVADKQELLDLVAQRTLADVGIPDESVGLWDCRLRMLIDGIDSQLRRNPGIAGFLLQRMLHSDRRLVDAFMAILLSAGLREPQVLLSYAMIHTYLFGRYQVALADVPHDATDLPPALAQVTPHLAGLHGTDYYTFGIETLIDGLRARVAENSPEGH